MKVLQLIDSLEPGGAERVAVSYANVLVTAIEGSYLCTTRKEGILKNNLVREVQYLHLNRKKVLDISALLKLRRFIKREKITIVHAHTTSYFFGTLLKMLYPKIQLIWHEHQGNRITTSRKDNKLLYYCSFFFSKIITVNRELQHWCTHHLATKKVIHLVNFVNIPSFSSTTEKRENTIICLANLKAPKNHLNLLEAYKEVHLKYPEWNLQLAGKDFMDVYSDTIKEYIFDNNLNSSVTLFGAVENVETLLNKASIGVLSSDNEGLPMALLEYGASELAVIATKAGDCEEVIGASGFIVPTKDPKALAQAIMTYIENSTLRLKHSEAFKNSIKKNYSLEAVFPELLKIYKS